MTKLDNFEFEVSICDAPHLEDHDGNCTRQVDLYLNIENDADAVLVLSELVKALHSANKLLNMKHEPKVEMVPPKMPDSFF